MSESVGGSTVKRCVKRKLLPLSRAERFLETLIEMLPRRNVDATVTPVDELIVLSDDKGEYQSTGMRPRFALNFATGYEPGWYYLEAALTRNNGSFESCIEIISGQRSLVRVPANMRGTVREVFYLPRDVTALYWLPTAAPGFFSQSPMLIHNICVAESFLRRAYRVITDLWKFKMAEPVRQRGITWFCLFSDLSRAYECTAELRWRRIKPKQLSSLDIRYRAVETERHHTRYRDSVLRAKPRISLIMPVRAPDPVLLKAAFDSVIGQAYPNWELLIASVPGSEGLREMGAVCEIDPRIQCVPVPTDSENLDIAVLLNSALAASSGDLIVRCDMHDRLAPHALHAIAAEYSHHPDAGLIYGDEDNIDADGIRRRLCVKPNWSPDLLMSRDYLGSPVIFHREALSKIGGYRAGYEGAEQYDLVLRYVKKCPDCIVRHIPLILYHRYLTTEILAGSNTDLRNHDAGRRALEDFVCDEDVFVENGPRTGCYRVKRVLPARPPGVSIIIPTRDKVHALRKCIASIQKGTDYPNWEIVLVDNQSVEPETLAYLEEIGRDTRIRVIRYDQPFNYSAINNFAVSKANGEIIALLNNDVEAINPEWLTEMVVQALRPSIGVVGAKLLYPNNTVQHAGLGLDEKDIAWHVHKHIDKDSPGYCWLAALVRNVPAVTGACQVVRKEIYLEVGGLNEINLAVAYNDVDFCLRVAVAGYRNLYTPFAMLYHHESLTRGNVDDPEKAVIQEREREYMRSTWRHVLVADPSDDLVMSTAVANEDF